MTRLLVAAFAAAFLATAAAAATPQRGGTLVYGEPGLAITCLNPFTCNNRGVLSQVLEGAYEPGLDGAPRPYLVSGVTIGRKPFTLTYHIRPQARWNDGRPVTSTDFDFTYRVDSKRFADYGRSGGSGRSTRRRCARAAGTVRRVAGDLLFRGLSRHVLAGEDLTAVWRDRIDNPKTGRPIGDGPFLIGGLERDRLILVRNRAYWGPRTAYLDGIVFDFDVVDAADPLGSLRGNKPDVVPLVGSLSGSAAEVRRLPGWRVVSWAGVANEHLAFRLAPGGHPALKNKLVRRALAYGIDRVEIARRINVELGRRARPLDSTVYLPGERSYRPNWSLYRYDPAQARRLLEQAGCRRGADGIYSCGGERLRLRFVTAAGFPGRERTLKLIKAQLERAGVAVEPLYYPAPAFFSIVLQSGEFDAALFTWLHSPGGVAAPEGKCPDNQNFTGYCSRLTMRDVQQAARILDPSLRALALNAADRKLVRDVPLLPLYQSVVRYAVKSAFRGGELGGPPGNPFEHSEDWWLAP